MKCCQRKLEKFNTIIEKKGHTCGAYSFEICVISVCVYIYICVCVCVCVCVNVVNRQAVQHFNIN